jgi:hypothetical protein
MNFSIKFIDQNVTLMNTVPCYKGEITIGDFKETFYSPINYWKKEDYEKQWHEAIERLKSYPQSCFIVKIRDPQCSKYVLTWPIYKIGEKLVFRNQMYFHKIYKQRLGNKIMTSSNCYEYIPQRRSLYERKDNISEWIIDLPDELKNAHTNYQKGNFRFKKNRAIWAL